MLKATAPRVLTIAGSDSGGGAGIEADLKTFTAYGVFGMAAITAVTAQNTVTVTGIHELPPAFVAEQIADVAGDIGVDAAKTGMLSNAAIIEAVARAIVEYRVPWLVIDPVMVAKSGDALLHASARDALVTHLLPLCHVITPNIPEAEALTGNIIATPEEVREAVRRIHEMGPRFVLIKGGHLGGTEATDLLFDGTNFRTYTAPRFVTRNTHGTGCTYSAAIAAGLAKGFDAWEAVRIGKEYVTEAIRNSFALGHGHGPLNHFWAIGQPYGENVVMENVREEEDAER